MTTSDSVHRGLSLVGTPRQSKSRAAGELSRRGSVQTRFLGGQIKTWPGPVILYPREVCSLGTRTDNPLTLIKMK